jgi:hypothetical protein
VERSHGVFQDRFVKQLRLRDVSSIAAANAVLEGGFLEDLNRRITVSPLEAQDAHVKINKRVNLRTIFCFEDTRTVSNDWVVRHANRYFQLIRQKGVEIRANLKVTIAEWLDGSIHILYKNKELLYEELSLQTLKQVRMGKQLADYIATNFSLGAPMKRQVKWFSLLAFVMLVWAAL